MRQVRQVVRVRRETGVFPVGTVHGVVRRTCRGKLGSVREPAGRSGTSGFVNLNWPLSMA
jgi:hypothetical protein